MSRIIEDLIVAMNLTAEENKETSGFTMAEKYFYIVDRRQAKRQVMFPTNFVHRLWNRLRA